MGSTPLRIVGSGDGRAVLVDEPASFRVEGATPGGVVDVEARFDLQGAAFRSAARFVADGDGGVDPAVTASTGGSYEGVDPFGLFWAADPTGPSPRPPYDAVLVQLRATDIDTGASADGTLERHWLAGGATVEEVDDDEAGVHGIFACPAGPGPFPAVVAFGGSGGGLGPSASWAPLLASHGFAVLAIAYFAAPKLPEHLVEIEVEVVDRAVAWLRARPAVAADARPVVMGQSRGGELALLAAATWPDRIGGAVVFSGSGLVWSALGPGTPVDRAAWTLGGEPVPYLAHGEMPPPDPEGGPLALTPLFDDLVAEGVADEPVIPVERIGGPVLAVSGEDDAMWPAVRFTEIAERRAAERGFAHGFTHLRYPGAGHTAPGPPGVPVFVAVHHGIVGRQMAFGGTRPGVAAARADSWPNVLAFLADAAGASPAR